MLSQLTIQGFKSIQDLTDFKLRNLNVLIGANGSGKSNLISFFRLLNELMNERLTYYVRKNGGLKNMMHHGKTEMEKIHFEAIFGKRGYRFDLEADFNDNPILLNEARYCADEETAWWNLGNSDTCHSKLVKEVEDNMADAKYSAPVYDEIMSWQLYHFHDTKANAPMRSYEIIEDKKKLRSDASNIAPFLLHLKKKEAETYKQILEVCHLVMPYLKDFLLEPESFGPAEKVRLSWVSKSSDYSMQPYNLSDGSIRFICLATALLQPNPPQTILIDEPELGLHPSAIALLAELLEVASKRMQVIVATQSPVLVDYFSPEDIVVVNRKNGASTFERLNADDYTEWLKEYSLGELWRKNVVRGDTVYE
jgi:predicted ATPase